MDLMPPNTGHFEVGCTDFMTSKNWSCNTDGASEVNKNSSHEIPGYFMKLFYPTAKGAASSYRLAKWIPKGIYANGYINFLHLPVFLFGRIGKWFMGTKRYLTTLLFS